MTAPGQVFVFNLSAEDLVVSVNGEGAGTARGWTGPPSEGGATPFAAAGIVVPRVLNSSDALGKFYCGVNDVIFRWMENPHLVKIDLLHKPMAESYVIYVSEFRCLLMDPYGTCVFDTPIGD